MHVIRLRGPWDLIISNAARADSTRRLLFPVTVAEAHQASRDPQAKFQRRFNRPTGIARDEDVILRLRSSVPVQFVRLNKISLTIEPDGRSQDIRQLLVDHNVLIVRLDLSTISDPRDDRNVLLEAQLEILVGPI